MRLTMRLSVVIGFLAFGLMGCIGVEQLLNPAFVNQTTGEVFPLVPGDRTGFILVRGVNSTSASVEFLVTVERRVDSEDQPGVLVTESESFRLFAPPAARANDVGVLVNCPAFRIGLGEDLDRPNTDPGIFLGAEDVGIGGLGVPSHVNPLNADFGNFQCGDTIVFEVSEANNTSSVGGVSIRSFVLDADAFSGNLLGRDTFGNARTLFEEQQAGEQ